MAEYPSMTIDDKNAPVHLQDLNISSFEKFKASFSEAFQQATINTGLMVEKMDHQTIEKVYSKKVLQDANIPLATYTTQEDINQYKQDRPDLEIPVGVRRDIADQMVQLYDDKQHFETIRNFDAGWRGSISAFVGSAAGSLFDVPSTAIGAATGSLASKFVTPVAFKWLGKMGASKLFGLSAGETTYGVTQAAIHDAAFGGGFSAGQEIQKIQLEDQLLKPHNYLQNLQAVGENVAVGGFLGIGRGVIAPLILGRARAIDAEGNILSRAPLQGEESVRVGGLLGSRSFASVSDKTKDFVGRQFNVLTDHAEKSAKEESAGQMQNGQMPNVDIIVKKGVHDAGVEFREAIDREGIDQNELLQALVDARDEHAAEISDLLALREKLKKSDEVLITDEKLSIKENKDLSQAGILKAYEKAQFNPELVENAPATIPENLRQHIEIQNEINRLQSKIDATPGEPNKQTVKRINRLKKRQPKVLTPKEELKAIKKALLDDGLPDDYESSGHYQRLRDLAAVWKNAKNLLDRIALEAEHKQRMNDAFMKTIISKVMEDHITDSHENITQADIDAYVDHLNNPAMEKVTEEVVTEKPIDPITKPVDDNMMNQLLAELPEKSPLRTELSDALNAVKNEDAYREMAAQMAECILRSSV